MLAVLLLEVAMSGCSWHEDAAQAVGGNTTVVAESPICVDATLAGELESLVENLNAEERAPLYSFVAIPGGLGGCAESNFGTAIPVKQHMLWHPVDYDPIAEKFEASATRAPSDNP